MIRTILLFVLISIPLQSIAQKELPSRDSIFIYGNKLLEEHLSKNFDDKDSTKAYYIKYVTLSDDNDIITPYDIMLMGRKKGEEVATTYQRDFSDLYLLELYEKSIAGEIDCYRFDGSKKLNVAEIENIYAIYGPLEFVDPVTKELKTTIVLRAHRDLSIAYAVALVEEWTINSDHSFSMEIIALAPVLLSYDMEAGLYQGIEILCWYVF